MLSMIRKLFIFLILILGLNCTNKPYQPNYDNHSDHNSTVGARDKMVRAHANKEINKINKRRKKARKKRAAKSASRRAEKDSKKLIK